MSFCYVNKGYKKFLNFFVSKNAVQEIVSDTYNPDNHVCLTATKMFGNIFNESISELYGTFGFYVNTNSPVRHLLKMSSYNSSGIITSDSSVTMPVALSVLDIYPDNMTISNGKIPFSFKIGSTSVYASSDSAKCASTLSYNRLWFHIKLNSSGTSTFEFRMNENSVYVYSFSTSSLSLGDTICFELGENIILSNIILSTISILPNEKLIGVDANVLNSTATYVDGQYRFTDSNQSINLSLSRSYPNSQTAKISRVICCIATEEKMDGDFVSQIGFRDTVVGSSYTYKSIPDEGDNVTFVSNVSDYISNIGNHQFDIIVTS